MKRIAVLFVLLLSVAAAGCASAPSRATDTALTQRSGPISAEHVVVVNCSFKQQTRPSSFVLTCADANDVLTGMHWVSWGPGAAFATGVEQINSCTPDCADGKFVSYPVLVNLWRPEALPGHPGTFYFSRATRVYTANRPPLYYCNGTHTCYPLTSTFDLWH